MLVSLPASATLIRGDLRAQSRSIDEFFDGFTAEWVRPSPNQATAMRYFAGPEQDALETQLTPVTREWRGRRVALARRGLAELAAFDRARLGQVASRMGEATAEAAALAEKRLVPPRFIVSATITQMEQFISTPPAQNPFVSVFNDRMAAGKCHRCRRPVTVSGRRRGVRVPPAPVHQHHTHRRLTPLTREVDSGGLTP